MKKFEPDITAETIQSFFNENDETNIMDQVKLRFVIAAIPEMLEVVKAVRLYKESSKKTCMDTVHAKEFLFDQLNILDERHGSDVG